MMLRTAWCAAVLVALGASQAAAVASDTLPLPERIDRLIETAAVGPLAPRATDADFVRRVHLDLTGIIPTAERARAFLADGSADKRPKLIDELLASSDFVRHMTLTFDVLLLERRGDKHGLTKEWYDYLYTSLAEDKPLDQLFRELIAADGADPDREPSSRFLLNREAEPNLVTRDIGRLAFGMDLQCAQCHDHPLIDDYYQADYYGLYAFVQRTAIFLVPSTKRALLMEKADGEAGFKSVFTGDGQDQATLRLPKGAVLFAEPTFAKDEGYEIKPEKGVRGVPKYSRRDKLGEMLGESEQFRRNLANRLWAMMFGRGLVDPVDFHHAGNPPSHPELLSLLADELQASGFRLRPLLRAIANTRAYQRMCDAPQPETVNFGDVAARLERLARERETQLAAIDPLKTAHAAAKTAYQGALDKNQQLAAELPKLESALADARQAMDKAAAERKAAEEALAKTQEQNLAVAEAATKAEQAAAKIANDPVLSEAAAKIAERAREIAAALQAATAAASERVAQYEMALRTVPEREQALTVVASSRVPPESLSSLQHAELNAWSMLRESRYRVAAVERQIATCQALLDYQKLAASDPAKAAAAWDAIVERFSIGGQVARLRPLTPEQFAASSLQAVNLWSSQRANAAAAVEKKPPESLTKASDAEKPVLRTKLVELRLIDQLDKTFDEFVKHYGGEAGQVFQATVNQALFFGNGGTIEGWLKPTESNLVGTLAKIDDPAALADALYFAVLSRPPTSDELADAAAALEGCSDKPAAIGELAWALLSSNEFRFNH